jgi:CheY-like chemotaxis protein
MARILLADDSPHAQRMGERILREEGHEVVSVTDADTALVRLTDVDPDLVLVDVSLPGMTGYDLCREVKSRPEHSHVRVLLLAGVLEPVEESAVAAARCDGVIKKPFEASVVMDVIRPLIAQAQADKPVRVSSPAPPVDAELVRAAVTLAVERALPSIVDALTAQVVRLLETSEK